MTESSEDRATIFRSAIMKPVRSLNRFAAAALGLMLLTGCASAPPTRVTTIDPLVGTWAGTVDMGGHLEPFYLTVNADQTLVATWGLTWSWGRITIANGQATYQMAPPPLEGSMRFYQEDGKPALYMDDLFATFHAVVTRQP